MYTLTCIKWITSKNLLYKIINKIKFKTIIIFQDWAWVVVPPCGHGYYLEFKNFSEVLRAHLNLSFWS